MNESSWKALDALAAKWRTADDVREVMRELPSNVTRRPLTGIAEMVQNFSAGGLDIPPMQLWSTVSFALSQEQMGWNSRPVNLDTWLTRASAIEQNYRAQVAWLRAQVPGYPMLRVPHLVDGTDITTNEYTRHLIWPREDLSRGLQLISRPPISILNGAKLDLGDETLNFLMAAQASEAWIEFSLAAKGLTDADKAMLHATNASLRSSLRPDAVDAFEPNLAIRRSSYRTQKLREAVESLSGGAATYARTFGILNAELEEAIGHVLGHLVAYGRPGDIGPISDLDFIDKETISFEPQLPTFDTGGLVVISDPLVAEVGIVTKLNFVMDAGDFRQQAEVKLLHGARKAWSL